MADQSSDNVSGFCWRCGAHPPELLAPSADTSLLLTRTCPACATAYPTDFRFCPTDGRALVALGRDGRSEQDGDARVRLSVLRGTANNKNFTLTDGEHIVGRDVNECTVVARTDPYLSPRHAKLIVSAGMVAVEDAGSENGTFVRCDARMPVWDKADILAGTTLLRIELAPRTAAPEGAPPLPTEDH